MTVADKGPRGGRRVAVFGYTSGPEGKGVPEVAEQWVIVRAVAISRKFTGEDSTGSGAENSQRLDASVFEVGVSLAGNFLHFKPCDSDELLDMLKTSGLGLQKEDDLHFFKFVPHGQNSPKSRGIEDLLPSQRTDDREEYTHALLSIPDNTHLRQGSLSAYAEIADAGPRLPKFLLRPSTFSPFPTPVLPLFPSPTLPISTPCVPFISSRLVACAGKTISVRTQALTTNQAPSQAAFVLNMWWC